MQDISGLAKPKGESLTDTVFLALREEIILNQHEAGMMLSEAELATRFGVSKTPVREALGRLRSEGLIEVIPHKGYLVASVSLRDLRELFELRMILECGAAELAASLDSVNLRPLEQILTPSDGLTDRKQFVQLNHEFHVGIARLTGNERLVRQVASVNEMLQRAIALNSAQGQRDIQADEHDEILHQIRVRNVTAARHLMAGHIERTRDRIVEQLLRRRSGFE